MSFFKDFKDDLSQAVNELLPEDGQEKEDQDTEEDIVDTLEPDEEVPEDSTDNEKMMEWLNEFTEEEEKEDKIEGEPDNNPEELSENTEEIKEDEGARMEDNVDLELLEALNADEKAEKDEEIKEEGNKEKTTVKPKMTAAVNDDEVTVISKGTTINGSITSDGSLDIMGSITGDIECLGKLSITGKVKGNSTASEVYVNTERMEGSVTSEGSVKIGLGTVVIGDITASSGVIAGAVKGEIDVNGPIIIDSTAIIKGNIKAKSVQINNGAVIEGFCSLSYSEVNVDTIFE